MFKKLLLVALCISGTLSAQDYFLEKYKPFNTEIPSPEQFLGYGIGEHHTRHDLIVAYLTKLAEVSERASIYEYGKTHEGRKLVILTITTPENLQNLDNIKEQHLAFTDPSKSVSNYNDVPIFINLAYNVHGNEPSSSEAALLAAYTFVASDSPEISKYLNNSIIMVDPTINPDGRDRHTQYANMYQGSPLVADPQDAEHNEYWPRGRTNHYWFDLNRDWLLGINPESRGKLTWYHEWYPNVVTDFHEMGSQSSYFFEPMKVNASQDPIMPKENYEDLNNLFGDYFASALDSIGSFYFTKEVFDGTYPGYGSSYPDLQGGLGLLFEQASSRGHKQKTKFGEITFPFTIRNQFTSSITTVRAAVENKGMLRKYQQDFFKSALGNASRSKIRGYIFKDDYDKNREKAFIDKLLLHKIDVYKSGNQFVVPTNQPQYRMVQTMFETYSKYRDSVYYDASAWSVANFYNMKYKPVTSLNKGEKITTTADLVKTSTVKKTDYAYIINYDDYNATTALNYLQQNEIVVSSSFKPFTTTTNKGLTTFNYGTLVIPVSLQKKGSDDVFKLVQKAQQKFQVDVHSVNSGYSNKGIDLGSRYVSPITKPKAMMLIGDGVRSYEAGEVWHLLDTRVHMPITKIPMRNFNRANMDKYNTLVMVSGNYNLNKKQREKIKTWVSKGNTLITIGSASKWVINKKLVNEKLTEGAKKDSSEIAERKPYVDAGENIGKESVGGAIFKVDLDLTHPLAFGYRDTQIPVYKNNSVWLAPSKNEYATVAKYTQNPHIDGFITKKNKEEFLKPSASLVVSKVGRGRVVLFADNPNFRGSWYGTNRLFLNALFLGDKIRIPE
ncbi:MULTISPECIES: M14 family zinc carboxypeptidase [Croceitalea]|uniref:M14 family zinc carboxypeptidase n=1 Tax=Croceitalea vernalis TaxID=3075599 RepID=A0ABU3BKU6_9FLAO|nr:MULTISPECIES: M14 family zinc carboxypeptidase [unclassified Croceitalea]MDT0540799.1 M14 family zinc carboxypeptidase [Croceitalea sp. P059]MDT0622778.1 M14 family zinc carboxypeptidase [Croceitalea sp. P007]